MSTRSSSTVARIVDRVFPRMPDFYGLINEQCDLLCDAMDVFVEFMESGDRGIGEKVRAMEHRGDELKSRQIDTLNQAFATPMDREDIYRAIVTNDEILNYAKTTVREIEALKMTPDAHMAEMARQIRAGTRALRTGYRKLSSAPLTAEADAAEARKAERNTEKVYRTALAELFEVDAYAAALNEGREGAQADALRHIIYIFKRRELYRHLSNAADRLEHAAGVLHDIAVQIG